MLPITVVVRAAQLAEGIRDGRSTQLFGLELPVPPWLAALGALLALVAASLLFEQGLLRFLRAGAKRTQSRVDDVVFEKLAPMARTVAILLGIELLGELFLEPSWRPLQRRLEFAAGVAILSFQGWRLLTAASEAWAESRARIRAVLPSVRLGLQVLLIPIVIVTILQIFEVPIMPLATTLGIGGLAVGLALQDVLKNVFAGIQIILDQPVRVGEYVDLMNGLSGTVQSIGLRTTRLRTAENNTIFVPNSHIASVPLVNWDAFDRDYVCRVKVRLKPGADVQRVRAALESEIDAMVGSVRGVKERRSVLLDELALTGPEFRVEVVVERKGHRELSSAVRERIWARLAKDGLLG